MIRQITIIAVLSFICVNNIYADSYSPYTTDRYENVGIVDASFDIEFQRRKEAGKRWKDRERTCANL